jgi:hypothetical protein|tara:strand:- start:260 stop:781 length:522 start_codon:yes stop_codon:yes gene_type:complete
MNIEDFKAIVSSGMCKGVNASFLSRSSHNHLTNLSPTDYLTRCYEIVGVDPKWPRPISQDDTSDTYAKALRESDDWEEVIPSGDFYSDLQDFDLLTWAYSRDGAEGCNGEPGLDGGNTTTGFLIKASQGYPTAWVSPDINTPSGVYPLEECLTLEKKQGSGMKAKLIYIHRRI